MQNALQLPPADEVLLAVGEEPSNRVLLAGCDPTTSFLGRYLQGEASIGSSRLLRYEFYRQSRYVNALATEEADASRAPRRFSKPFIPSSLDENMGEEGDTAKIDK